jgi:4-hydroxythreonine-4-phosphate dehydrogenase
MPQRGFSMTTLALTPGCPAGIGPEIFPLALEQAKLKTATQLIWCASPALFLKHAKDAKRNGQLLTLSSGQTIECTLRDEDDLALLVKAGHPDSNALASQRGSLDIAIKLAKEKMVQGIVTGPIRKAALADVNGIRFDGQTEYLHHFLAADKNPPLMCFAGADFLLGLATIHVPIKNVARAITPDLLDSHVRRLNNAVKSYFGTRKPRIVVFGLNPHAGEGGLIGDEESLVIQPVLEKLRKEGCSIEGPVAADGFFGQIASGDNSVPKPHAVLAMYHDQGLGPYKLLCKGVGVNMTMGLTVARTSPAHGTADTLAGTYKASPASMARALEVCSLCE